MRSAVSARGAVRRDEETRHGSRNRQDRRNRAPSAAISGRVLGRRLAGDACLSRSHGTRDRTKDADGVMNAGAAERSVDPRRYFEAVELDRSEIAGGDPVCLYLETTNRCNLPCTTCPRTFEELEPAANMSWDLFRSIVDQYSNIARVVLHGVGEPLMVPNLPRMIRYLK